MKTTVLFGSFFFLTTFPVSAQVYDNPGGTITTCAGTFNDKGGSAATYGNNEKIVTTFCSATPDSCIRIDFTAFGLDSKSKDVLKIYDGPDTISGLMGVYTWYHDPGTVVSSTGCLTFAFTSDTSTTASGWEADIRCTSKCAVPVITPGVTKTICSAKFYDSGSHNTPYGNNEKSVTTFCSSMPDSCIQADFTAFGLDSKSKDMLKIYDGPDTTSERIGYYTWYHDPGIVVSSKGCLTFAFTSDTSTTASGWEADIRCTSKCAAPVITTDGTKYLCSGKFYDSGGSNNNYGNNESSVTTLCSNSSGNPIQADFIAFGLDGTSLDILKIYDGTDTVSGFINAYTWYHDPGTVISSSGCLTFKFTSNASTTSSGWEAAISCPGTISVPEITGSHIGFDLTLQNNPATSYLRGELYSFKEAAFTLDITDLQGRIVSREKIQASKGLNTVIIDLNRMEKGLYIIRVNNNVNGVQKKFLKL